MDVVRRLCNDVLEQNSFSRAARQINSCHPEPAATELARKREAKGPLFLWVHVRYLALKTASTLMTPHSRLLTPASPV
jgi:hypothetical protein